MVADGRAIRPPNLAPGCLDRLDDITPDLMKKNKWNYN
jgi:hypothetical protein